ncbi:MAG: response regulator, partial [Pirellulales bacterium]
GKVADVAPRDAAASPPERSICDSEARYRALFDSTGDAIVLLDETGFFECNEATLRFFRCHSREDFISRHPSELSPPVQPDGTDSRSAADTHIAEALREGMARFEWMHRRMDGTDVMSDVLLARVDIKDRKILQAVIRDITGRKHVEQALRSAHDQLEQRVEQRTAELARANEELKREIAERKRAEEDLAYERFLLTTLMEHAPDFIFFKDLESRFIRISKCQADYYGLDDPRHAIGKSDFDFYDAGRARQYLDDERRIMQTGHAEVAKEEEQVWSDGHVTWLLTSKLPLRDADGRVIGTFGLSRDITQRKQAESQLQAAKETAEHANRAKSDFLANMSHEIRTPLNAIIGMTELLLDTTLTDSQRDYLAMVRDSGDALLSLINDVLDFSKIEATRLELELAPFEVRESLGDTMKSMAVRAHDKGLELAFRIAPEVPSWLVGDVGRLRQVVVNLVGNAIKFTEAGEVVLRVACEVESAGDVHLHFTVTDTGIGISEEKRETIFEAFEQADNSLARRYGGTGLGLAICVRLVEAMGGRIWVESEPRLGSTFHFTARLARYEREESKGPAPRSVSVSDTRVLVVDDNGTNRSILEEILQNWGMRPASAGSASEALGALHGAFQDADPYALVLSDAHMPEIDGFSLAERIKQDDILGSTVIMMLTSGGRPGDVCRCERLGIEAYLLKPIKQSELFDAIVHALGITVAEDEHERESVPRSRRLEPLRILLAEDSIVNQKLAVGLLEKQGHRVVVAGNGRQAIAALEHEPFDLVLMDVQMPDMDGLEAARTIRARERERGTHLPIIAMTAHALKGDRELCLEAGMDDYVSKPIRVGQLVDAMEGVLLGSPVARTPHRDEETAASVEEESPIDWDAAWRTVDGDGDLLLDVIHAFLDESPRLMTTLRQAVADRDAYAVRIAAHTLKSALRSLGALDASEHASRLEAMGREEEFEGVEEALVTLERDLQYAVPALKQSPPDPETHHGDASRLRNSGKE